MNVEDLNKLKEKIQKLLSKADSAKEIGNAEEAAAFSAKVQDLLTKYNLEKADISFEQEDEVIGDNQNDLMFKKNLGKWSAKLVGILGKFNYCKPIFTHSNSTNEMSMTLIGKRENVEIVIFLYEILKRQLDASSSKAWKTYLSDMRSKLEPTLNKYTESERKLILKKPWKYVKAISSRSMFLKSYFLGAVNGVHLKLKAQMEAATVQYGDKMTSLVKVNDAGINEYMKKEFPDSKTFGNRSQKVNNEAYSQGVDAGKNASMARGVATGDSVGTKMLA